ncbi:MAG: hypothetical protein IPI58_04565 [Alphaproteobacteria bacterium]|nr:MAG: hypothetical protein IPI58_04565 [Alphaproteobacteria bacterium]
MPRRPSSAHRDPGRVLAAVALAVLVMWLAQIIAGHVVPSPDPHIPPVYRLLDSPSD